MCKIDKTSHTFEMTAVCGIYCGSCECHTSKDNPELLNYLVSAGINAKHLPCTGCRKGEGDCPVIGGACETYLCAKQKKVDFCYECDEYPCSRLIPAADRAERIPHNLKVFNLAYIEHQGLEKFASEAPRMKEKYFKGKMMIGKGPQLG